MRNPVLIGVGGTGQTIIAAYLRLAELAGFTPAPFYVVDSDRLGALSKKVTELKSRIDKSVGGADINRWMIDPFPTADVDRKTFGSLFGNLTGERRELFNCLFTEDAEFTRIRTGMYGRPSIGATSIRYKLLNDDDDLKELKNTLRGGEKHIILVGSCFGGTGSGGVPMLAAEFAKLNGKEGYNLKIDAVTFLPWFRLVLDGDLRADDKSLHDRLNEHFEPNAAAGIFYFKDKIREYVDTLILIGVKDPGLIQRKSNESNQGETVHILNLLTAVLIQNHFTENLDPPDGIAGFWYDDTVGIDPKFLEIHRGKSSYALSLLNVIKRTAVRREWFNILKTLFENYGRIDKLHQPPFLNAAFEKLKGTVKTDVELRQEIIAYMTKMQEAIQDGFGWLEGMHDEVFFRLNPEDKKVMTAEHESKLSDPLPVVSQWCSQEEVVGKFEEHDFKSTDRFCEKFTNLFFDNLLTKEFKL